MFRNRKLLSLAFVLLSACKAEEAVQLAATDAAPSTTGAARALVARETAQPQPRMIVRNAALSIIVRDAAAVMRNITAAVETHGGYVADARQWKEREQVRATATVRVPSARLTAALGAIRGFAVRVESESMTAQDVSREFVDLGAQLRNLQAAEVELRELLETIRQKSGKAADVIEIYNEVARVRGEIERIQGRMQHLSQLTAFSTITVECIPDALAAPVVEPGWRPMVTVRTALRALVDALKAVAVALIWLGIYVLPIALLCVAAALAMRSVWLRVRRYHSAPWRAD